MEHHQTRFTAGQFARLHNINKRTLHYYDDIGLFSPAFKGENGYRYYTFAQSAALELLLAMRELGMSIEEIAHYMHHRSAQDFCNIITTKTAQIDESIKRLKDLRKLLAQKEANLRLCQHSDLDAITLIDCPEEYLLRSGSIAGNFNEDDLSVLLEHAQHVHSHRLFNNSYGSMISAENIAAQNWDDYACFFTRVGSKTQRPGLFCKPGGTYIRAFCKGDWDKLPATYGRIAKFAQAHGLTLKGYAYEEGLNEIAIQSMEEYVTQVLIMCE